MAARVLEQRRNGGELTIILLAAGSSSRMGQSKQKLSIDGTPMLVRAVETALKSKGGKVIVVLGSEAETHRELLKGLPVEPVFNPRWQTGMGSSLKAGLSYTISHHSNATAIVVAACDQPLLQPSHIQSLIDRYRKTGAHAVASAYANTVGIPALFDQDLFDEILKLDDAQGAKKVIQQHPAALIDFPAGAVDLDTPDDYKTFLEQHSKKMC